MNQPKKSMSQREIDQSLLEKALQRLQAGNVNDAAELSQLLMQQNPQDFQALQLAANVALEQQRLEDANALYKLALQNAQGKSEQACAWHGLGATLRQAQDYRQAEEAYRRATLIDPTVASHWTEYGRTLAMHGKPAAAMEAFCVAIQRDSQDPTPCGLLGNTLVQLDRHADALVLFQQALKRQPDNAPAHFNLGTTLQTLGRFEEARLAYEKALQLNPEIGGFSQLAQVKTFTPDDPHIPQLESLFAAANMPADIHIDAGFALAKAYDDLGDYDKAFSYLLAANRSKRATLDYSTESVRTKIERLMAVFDQNLFGRLENLGESTLAPIFIVSMPRSGSTLLEQMLAGHTELVPGGELDGMKNAVRDLVRSWVYSQEISGKDNENLIQDINRAVSIYTESTQHLQRTNKRFTDKAPQNFMHIGFIRVLLPHAKIIHITRDAVDTCFSCYQKLFSSFIPYSYDLQELGQYHKLYQKLMQHWHATCPGKILDVSYESLVRNPERTLREVMKFCELEYQANCLEFTRVSRPVTTASSVQVRKPLYETSVHRWRRYEKHLEPLLAALQD